MASMIRCYSTLISRPKRTRRILKGTCFEELPPELWHLIASYLPLASAASLVFACRSALRVFGTQCWVDLNASVQSIEKMRFLEFLDKSLPKHYLCQRCRIFHRRQGPEWCHISFTGMLFLTPWKCEPLNEFFLMSPHTVVRWSAIHLIMRAHRYGPRYGISLKSLNADIFNAYGGRDWSRHSIARIVDGRLLIRVRALYWMPRTFPSHEKAADPWPENTSGITCRHSVQGGSLHRLCLAAITDLSLSTFDEFAHESSTYRCLFCPTEYMVHIRQAHHFKEPSWPFPQIFRHRYILSITRWIDVGDGLSIKSKGWTALTTKKRVNQQLERFDYSRMQGIRTRFESRKS